MGSLKVPKNQRFQRLEVMNCYTYYVYQSTPFDLAGTPDFASILADME